MTAKTRKPKNWTIDPITFQNSTIEEQEAKLRGLEDAWGDDNEGWITNEH